MARTQTQAKTEQVVQPAVNRGELTLIQQPRLPYHPELSKFDIDIDAWRALIDTIFPGVNDVTSIVLALSYCKKRNLDVWKRPVHIVPIYSRALKRMVNTVWPGISEIRTTAARTGQYAGCDQAIFGPLVEKTWTVTFEDEDRQQKTREIKVTYPSWCQITVHRIVHGHIRAFVGPKVAWEEVYATAQRNSDVPNEMWQNRPEGQLEKCAEAAALRRAFPEEVGNDLIDAEVGHGSVDYDSAHADHKTIDGTATEIKQKPEQATVQQKPAQQDQSIGPEAIKAWLEGLRTRLASCQDSAETFALRQQYVDGFKDKLTEFELQEAYSLVTARLQSFSTVQDTSSDEPPV